MVLFEGRTAPKTNDWKLKNHGFQRKNPIFQASRGWFKRYVMLRGKKHLIIFDEVVMYAAVLWPRGMWDIRFYSSCHVGRSVTWKAKTAEHGLFQSWKYTFAHNNMFGILGHPPANIGIRHYQSSSCHQQSIYTGGFPNFWAELCKMSMLQHIGCWLEVWWRARVASWWKILPKHWWKPTMGTLAKAWMKWWGVFLP